MTRSRVSLSPTRTRVYHMVYTRHASFREVLRGSFSSFYPLHRWSIVPAPVLPPVSLWEEKGRPWAQEAGGRAGVRVNVSNAGMLGMLRMCQLCSTPPIYRGREPPCTSPVSLLVGAERVSVRQPFCSNRLIYRGEGPCHAHHPFLCWSVIPALPEQHFLSGNPGFSVLLKRH